MKYCWIDHEQKYKQIKDALRIANFGSDNLHVTWCLCCLHMLSLEGDGTCSEFHQDFYFFQYHLPYYFLKLDIRPDWIAVHQHL